MESISIKNLGCLLLLASSQIEKSGSSNIKEWLTEIFI